MRPLQITSDLLLLFVLPGLLWGANISSVTSAPTTTVKTSAVTSTAAATPRPTTAATAVSTPLQPPENVRNVTVLRRNESSVTLSWLKVSNISTYTLQWGNNGRLVTENITASPPDASVTREVSRLNAGTLYNFTVHTVFGGVPSSGLTLAVVTAIDCAGVAWRVSNSSIQATVDGLFTNATATNGSDRAHVSAGGRNVTFTDLYPGATYRISLVYESYLQCRHNLTLVPNNADGFTSVGQTETSITLQWKKVNAILNYILQFSGSKMNVSATENNQTVTQSVSGLDSGTKYTFTLVTVVNNIRSSGVNLTAVTAPGNAEDFKSVGQTETSITLQWNKVDGFLNYVLQLSESETNVTAAAAAGGPVTYTAWNLTAGTEYSFTLFTVLENVRSSGVNLSAVTAPRDAEDFRSVGQTETSVTLQWSPVDAIVTYVLNYSNTETNVTAAGTNETATQEVSDLSSGTEYLFTLFSVFESVRSAGVKLTAVTAPENVGNVTVLRRNESSVTLSWLKVSNISTYTLQWGNNGRLVTENITASPPDASVTREVSRLNAGTLYNFTVHTVFGGVPSSGLTLAVVTAIDCAGVAWRVSNSSIQATVDGLFTNATATNGSDRAHVSAGGRNVTFTDLYPGATYRISLVYESYLQCRHNLTLVPPGLAARCEYWAAGYSARVVWHTPDGVWTEVEVNVTGRTHHTAAQHIVIPGLLPATTYQVSVASLAGTLRSSAPFVFLCSTDPRGVIAGSVLAALFGFLVCLVVFIVFIRRKKTFIGGSEVAKKQCNAISVGMFADHFRQLSADDSRGFTLEYESLVPVGAEQTQKAALLPENKPRNRFNNVLPYDWCRVKLAASSGASDYINASYMPGYSRSREYIATQGPLPSTVNDFWRMVWEQRVTGIVMVTNCTEGGRAKCEQYWPANRDPRLYGELSVTIRSEEKEPNWTLREFSVKHRDATELRTVKHFHFTSWPDHGVPQCTEVLIWFRGLVRHYIETEGSRAPTVVHCSAGVGRTGTIIALDVLLQQLKKKGAVDINYFVHKMRLNRPHMVQTESQYIFLHQCIMDSLPPDEKTDENIYENTDMIYENATALREFRHDTST